MSWLHTLKALNLSCQRQTRCELSNSKTMSKEKCSLRLAASISLIIKALIKLQLSTPPRRLKTPKTLELFTTSSSAAKKLIAGCLETLTELNNNSYHQRDLFSVQTSKRNRDRRRWRRMTSTYTQRVHITLQLTKRCIHQKQQTPRFSLQRAVTARIRLGLKRCQMRFISVTIPSMRSA